MKISMITLATLLALPLMAVSMDRAEASNRNQRIHRTQMRQNHRINQGVRSGELTKEEAKGLRKEQREIRQERKDAKRDDGVIDNQERKELRQDQAEASKHIYEEKHDAEKRE